MQLSLMAIEFLGTIPKYLFQPWTTPPNEVPSRYQRKTELVSFRATLSQSDYRCCQLHWTYGLARNRTS
jgi:hypothetical protein